MLRESLAAWTNTLWKGRVKLRKLIFVAFGLFILAIALIMWLYGPISFPQPDVPVIEKPLFKCPLINFYVRRDNEFAAIKIIRLTWNKGAIYSAITKVMVQKFQVKSVVYKTGKVYENYTEVPIAPSGVLKDKDGKLNIECGQFKIEWSSQNWIYFKGYSIDQSLFEIAPTMISDIAQVNVKDENLKWFYKR